MPYRVRAARLVESLIKRNNNAQRGVRATLRDGGVCLALPTELPLQGDARWLQTLSHSQGDLLQRLILLLWFALFLGGVRPLYAQATAADNTTSQALLAEVAQLRQVLTALKLSAAEQDAYAALLDRSDRAAHAGHLFLSLHILQAAAPVITGYEFSRAQHALAQSGLAAFEQEWRRLGPVLAARQRKLATTAALPLAVQAFSERALTQVQPTYQASLLYGQETSVENGLFYLGLAQGHLAFAAFCRQLKFAPRAAALAPTPAAELAALEKEVLAAYRQFDTPEQHSNFIRVNSLLKQAQDLARERRVRGAWLQVLEARRAFVPITQTTATQSAAELRTQSADYRAQLARATTDESLGWLYWQMAETALATDDLKQAQVILQHILPRCLKSQTRNKR